MAHEEKKYVPAKRDGRFECQVHEVKHGFLWDTAASLIKSTWARLRVHKNHVVDWYKPETPVAHNQELCVTWIGHATVLIQVAGLNILTDPIFGASSILYPRIIKPGIAFDDLPPIDLVLISHNHYDHMEAKSIRKLYKKNPHITFLVPQGNKNWFERRSINTCIEFVWWDGHKKGDDVVCTFLPAVHWTQRGLFDRNRSLWGSWMIETPEINIYFGGDTAFGPHFTAISRVFKKIDLAILPIGPCEPRAAMKHAHMDACDAIQACNILHANSFFPIHWGTFRFGDELPQLPIDRLQRHWKQHVVQNVHLFIPNAGQCNHITRSLLSSEAVFPHEVGVAYKK